MIRIARGPWRGRRQAPTASADKPAGPLTSRNFRLLVSGNVISRTGSAVSFVVIPFAVLSIGGSVTDVGLVATAELIPVSVFLLLGGVAADRLPRHRVIVASNALQATAQAISAALLLTGHARVWQLAMLAATGGLGLGFYSPAVRGLLPQTVTAGQLQQANALDRTGRSAAGIGGAALGGLLTGLAGPGWGLAIDAASFAVAGLALLGMRVPALPPAGASSMLQDLRDGWHEFASRRWLWVNVAQFALLAAISAGTANVLGPLVARSSLGGARSWGVILSAYSAGAVAGGLAMMRPRPRRTLPAALASVPAFSVLLFALAVPLAVPLDVVAALVAGGCLEVFGVSWATTIQREIPPAQLSRVSSYDTLGTFVLAPAGTAIAGPLAATFGTSAVLTLSGVIVVMLPLLILLLPDVRQLHRHPATPGREGRAPGPDEPDPVS